jgi:glycosyltransferase involved in cell wall biosynthesis
MRTWRWGRDDRSVSAPGSTRRSIAFLVWRDTTHPEGGGSELFVERVAEHLAEHGWKVTICAAEHANALRDEVRNGVSIRRRGGRLSVYLHGLAYLRSRAGRRTDIVVDVQNGLPFFSPLARRRGIVNLVHHVHYKQWQIIYPGLLGHVGWWLESRFAPWLYRGCPYITVSQASRRDLAALGIECERISIVYNGIDAPHPEHQQPRADAPTICVLGRLVPHKQVEHALQIAATARTALPDLRVEIVGEGWWHDVLAKRTSELGMDDAVTFHGGVPAAVRDEILDRSWVLVVPSIKEGWGIAIMEAAARGVPAVAYSAAGGVRESIVDGETGWLVEDIIGLEKRTEELLKDTALREWMGANARRRAAEFEWANTGKDFAAVLETDQTGNLSADRRDGSPA